MKYVLLVIFFSLPFQAGFGLGITHLNKPSSSFLSVSTQNGCSTYLGIEGSIQCNPALFPFVINNGLSLHGLIKSEGDSVEKGKDLIFESINKEFLESLFNENSLISFNLDSNLIFSNKYFAINYSPYYLVADAYISNPSFPEISLYLNKQRSITLSSGYDLSKYTKSKTDKYSIGSSIKVTKREYFKDNLVLTDFVNTSKNIIQFKEENEITLDIGLYLDPSPEKWIPKFSLQVKNIFAKSEINYTRLDSVTDLEPFLLLERHSLIGLGQSLDTKWGTINWGLNIPFEDLFTTYYSDYPSINVNYNLDLFMTTFSYSKYFQIFGLKFISKTGDVGIIYAKEEEIAGKSIVNKTDQHSVYVEIKLKP